MSTSSNEASYFDLHITGLGYLNRIREVTPKKGAPFLACDIAALNGPCNAAEYRRFDVRVSGEQAQRLVRRCSEAVFAKRKVMIGFRLGDLYAESFVYKAGTNAGQTGISLKARLLFISWIKVDGETVYKAEPSSASDTRSAQAATSEPADRAAS